MFHDRKKWEQNLINLFMCPLSPQTFFCGDIFVNFERTEKKSRKTLPLKGKKSNLIACVNCLISGMYCSMAIYICTNIKGTLYSLLQFRLDLIYVIHISGLVFFFSKVIGQMIVQSLCFHLVNKLNRCGHYLSFESSFR